MCSFVTTSYVTLLEHKRVNHGAPAPTFYCREHRQELAGTSAWQHHLNTEHSQTWACLVRDELGNVCERTFYVKDSLIKHLKRVHDMSEEETLVLFPRVSRRNTKSRVQGEEKLCPFDCFKSSIFINNILAHIKTKQTSQTPLTTQTLMSISHQDPSYNTQMLRNKMPNNGIFGGHFGNTKDPWNEPHFCPLKCNMKFKWFEDINRHFKAHIEKGQVTEALAIEKLNEIFPLKYPAEVGAAEATINSDGAGDDSNASDVPVSDDDLWVIFASQAFDD